MAIKLLSGDYALHQVVFARSLIGLTVFFAVFVPLSGGLRVLRTGRLGMHILRGLCVVFANMTFFLGVAALPLAEAVAIFFISPLLITVFSVVFLKETVGPRRWGAIAVGLIGVLIVLRPGTAAFQPAALLPLLAALGYATLHTLTRRLGATDGPATMAFYIQLNFLLVSSSIGLAVGDGRFDVFDNASLNFFFRAWSWPQAWDWALLVMLGCTSTLGGYLISQAYRVAESALIAPFEYIAMPLAVFWGAVVFDEWPDATAWTGIALILASGLFLIWRETQLAHSALSKPRAPR